MIVFRCTQRVAKRFRLELVEGAPSSTGLLGDWYANFLNVGATRLVLCLSERTLLPVIVPARQAEFPAHFPGYLLEILKRLGIARHVIDAECRQAFETAFAPTRSRSLLTTHNDFAHSASLYLSRGDSLLHASLALSEMPSKVIDFDSPQEVTRVLFAHRGGRGLTSGCI